MRPSHRTWAALIIVGCAFLAGCGNGRLLYSYEPPFWSALGDPGPLRFSMTVAALRAGYVPRFDVTVSADPVATLSGSLAGRAYSAAVVGPLTSFQWADFVPRFPGVKFVLIDAPPPAGSAPPNAVFLTFDRAAAFREAGRVAGRAAGGASAAASGADPAGPKSLVGMLSCDGSGLTPEESDSFARGVAEAQGGVLPLAERLAASPDPKDIRAVVTQMRGQGASVFLLGLGDRDPDGLEAVRDAGARAVVSDWQVSGALPLQVIASVEEDVTGGLRAALRALKDGTPRVHGPVRVVTGKKI